MAKLPQDTDSNKTTLRITADLVIPDCTPETLDQEWLMMNSDLVRVLSTATYGIERVEIVMLEMTSNPNGFDPMPEYLAPNHPMPPLPYNYRHGRG